jgi:hypothetical protein
MKRRGVWSAATAVQESGAELLAVLRRIDSLLRCAVAAADATFEPGASADPFRGLHVGRMEIERLLKREPGWPLLAAVGEEEGDHDAGLLALAEAFALSAFEVDVLVVALAPELDLKYERIFAYLQDDVTRTRPTVDLVLDLLCPSAEWRLARRAVFNADAPLLRGRMIELFPDGDPEAPLLRRVLKVDDQVVRGLLGTGGLDHRLLTFCELTPAVRGCTVLLPERTTQELASIVRQPEAPRLYFRGPPGSGRHAAATALAGSRGAPLLMANVAELPGPLAPILMREALLHGAFLYLTGVDELCRAERARDRDGLLAPLRRHPGPVILAGSGRWSAAPGAVGDEALALQVVEFPIPEVRIRGEVWRKEIRHAGLPQDGVDVNGLAGRFRLTAGQIREAAAEAAVLERQVPGRADERLFSAARGQTGHALGGLAVRLMPMFGWDDIVVPSDTAAQLREICGRVDHGDRVLGHWGFDHKLSLGRGISALFAGPPGTGKTMAAEVVANALRLDLYRIDLASVVSKWIGETEKNLDRIFTAARDANAILFFDEADALFGRRSEIKDSHDRYANIEIAYLLQKMEEHEGVALLATNRMDDLDDAFLRRLSFVVRFPFPEVDERERIWASVWPEAAPLAADVDWRQLAHEFAFTGAEIKNVSVAAAFLAAADDTPVTMGHIHHAARREYGKSGRSAGLADPTPVEGLT